MGDMAIADILAFVPKSIALSIASIMIGAGAFAGMEIRYVSASQFQKSYVLQLKREIRELRSEIADTEDDELRARLEEYLDELIDELCIEMPDDRECD